MSCVSLENVKVDQQKMKDWHGYSMYSRQNNLLFEKGPFFVKAIKPDNPGINIKQPICGKGGLISDFIITINACQKRASF